MAIVENEPDASRFVDALARSSRSVIAAPTLFELSMVSFARKNSMGVDIAHGVLRSHGVETIAWTGEHAALALTAFDSFGRSRHPAKLNFGDCMSYAVAKALDAPLLYKGDDFAQTDIRSAL